MAAYEWFAQVPSYSFTGMAVTIHKASLQGTILDFGDMELHGFFDIGQEYVACGQATSIQGLKGSSFLSGCILLQAVWNYSGEE
jgi:hypothetical protein